MSASSTHRIHKNSNFHQPQQHSNNTMNVSKMTIKLLKQELTKRGLPTDGLKPALVARLELALWKNSNEAFHFCTKQIKDTAAGIASAEEDVAALEDQLAEIKAELDAARHRIPVLKRE